MTNDPFLAKSNPMQTLREHTERLLALFEGLRGKYPELLSELDWEVLRDAALYHDFGKSSPHFQNQILTALKSKELVDAAPFGAADVPFRHNLISPSFIDRSAALSKYGTMLRKEHSDWEEAEIENMARLAYDLLVKSIGYHHGASDELDGLARYIKSLQIHLQSDERRMRGFDWADRHVYELRGERYPLHRSDLRLNQNVRTALAFETTDEIVKALRKSQKGRAKDRAPESGPVCTESAENRYFLIKGLLNKLDYCASAGMDEVEKSVAKEREIGRMTRAFLEKKGYRKRPVQEFMERHRAHNLIVESATGSGKTEAALLWLDEGKGFYTLPLKVSINAMYRRIRNPKEIDYPDVDLLHGDAFGVYYDESSDSEAETDLRLAGAARRYTEVRLLSSPLLVTTIDQLFTYVYKYNGGEPAFASMVLGKTIIDEIQMYEPELIAKLIYGLKMLTEAGGKFAIVTATFPKILYRLFDEYGIPYYKRLDASRNAESAGADRPAGWSAGFSPMKFYGDLPCRHRIARIESPDFDFDQIASIARTRKVLVIANTVRRTQEIARSLAERADCPYVRMLHSDYCWNHRKILEEEILEFAPNGVWRPGSGIWVTTSIVEASLNLDFDCLFTELRSVDSLIQRMGRVYRSRSFTAGDPPNVYVLMDGHTTYGSDADGSAQREIYERSAAALRSELTDDGLIWESEQRDDIRKLMDAVYGGDSDKNSAPLAYEKQIRAVIDVKLRHRGMYVIRKAQAKKNFRDIVSVKIIPRCVYEANRDAIDADCRILLDERAPREHKQAARIGIDAYCVSVTERPNLADPSRELFVGSGVYIWDARYDFDAETRIGAGLLRSTIGKPEALSAEERIL